jgi:hypothetical protein
MTAKQLRGRLIGMLTFLVFGLSPMAFAQLRSGQNAWLGLARGLINPNNGTAQVVAYMTFAEGISGPFFNGAPSEATAYFTFRSDTISITPPIANGPNLSATMFSSGTFSVYFNALPHGDFSDPDSFSSGQLIARFKRSPGMIVSTAGSTGTSTFSAGLAWSRDFVFQGKTVNFRTLVPHGVTFLTTNSSFFVLGPTDFPIAQPFAFSAITMGSSE